MHVIERSGTNLSTTHPVSERQLNILATPHIHAVVEASKSEECLFVYHQGTAN